MLSVILAVYYIDYIYFCTFFSTLFDFYYLHLFIHPSIFVALIPNRVKEIWNLS